MTLVLILSQSYLPFAMDAAIHQQIAYVCVYVISGGLTYGLALMTLGLTPKRLANAQ
jgi:hypothetical protein